MAVNLETIEFDCRQCKARLKVKASAAGQTVACPKCQAALVIPAVRPAMRMPLGDPPPGEGADPAQRLAELTATNRELQEKLRRKETELEVARLKIADLSRGGGAVAARPTEEKGEASSPPADAPPPGVESAPVDVSPRPLSKGVWALGIAIFILALVLGGWIGRRSAAPPPPIPAVPTPPVSAPMEPAMVVPAPVEPPAPPSVPEPPAESAPEVSLPAPPAEPAVSPPPPAEAVSVSAPATLPTPDSPPAGKDDHGMD